MAKNVAQHKIVNLLKTFWDFFVIMCCNVFNVWPRDAKKLDTPAMSINLGLMQNSCHWRFALPLLASEKVKFFKIWLVPKYIFDKVA